MAMRKLVEEGHRIRADYAVQGKQAKAEKQKQLQELGPQRDALQKKKDELLVCLNSHIHPTGISEIAFIDSFKAFCEWGCRVFIEKKKQFKLEHCRFMRQNSFLGCFHDKPC